MHTWTELENALLQLKNAHNGRLFIRLFTNGLNKSLWHFMIEDAQDDVKGFGDGFSAIEALQKAYSELVERKVFVNLSLRDGVATSNGFAAHPVWADASQNAIAELIERDVFLVSWFSKRSPIWLSLEDVIQLKSVQLQTMIDTFDSSEMFARLGVVGQSNGIVVTVIAILDRRLLVNEAPRFGFIVSTASGSNLREALEKNSFAALRNAGILSEELLQGKQPVPDSVLNNTVDSGFHRNHHLSPLTLERNAWFFKSSVLALSLPDISIEVMDVRHELKEQTATRLFIARAYSSEAQQHFVGASSSVNLKKSRYHGLLENDEFNKEPHPLS